MTVKDKVLSLSEKYICEELKGFYNFLRSGEENEDCEYYEFDSELEELLQNELSIKDSYSFESKTLFANPSLVLRALSFAFVENGKLEHFLFPLVIL